MTAKRGVAATVVLASMLSAIVGCSSDGPYSPVLVEVCPAALIEGVLVVAGNETAIQADLEFTPLTWPKDYTLRSDGSQIAILDERGNLIARTGEFVRLGGGLVTQDDHWTTCGPPLARR